MYNSFTLGWKYLQYWLKADNGKGHGVHSPFVFDFITQVLRPQGHYYCYDDIEALRAELCSNSRVLTVEDLGAGSRSGHSRQRPVKTIARAALKPPRFSQLLFRMANYYGAQQILELGTSLGITTSYLANACHGGRVVTMEGVPAIAAVARENFERQGLKNISVVEGNFDDTLPALLGPKPIFDLAYIDGNHRYEPTVRYFDWLLPALHSQSILVFDDIHWSREMESAWEKIGAHPSVTLTIDLFFIGIVFLLPEIKVKQHFSIRF